MNRQLVISGMHRSGTSLVASALRVAGVDIGRDVNPGAGNPRGHFEDQDFYRLHEQMLAASGGVWGAIDRMAGMPGMAGWVAAPAERFVRRGRELIAERSSLPLWGWKDPRTCMFLPFWDPLLPAANYLFTYRHVVDVALSLRRRGSDPQLRADPWLAIRAWVRYNRSLLDFCEEHPERCFLAQVPALAADLPGLVRNLAHRFELPLREEGVEMVWVPSELEPRADGCGVDWEELMPEALAVYRELEARADLPSGAVPGGVASRDRVPPGDAAVQRYRELQRAAETLFYDLLVSSADPGPLARAERHRDSLSLALSEEKRQHGLAIESLGQSRSQREELALALTAQSDLVAGLREELTAAGAHHRQAVARLTEVSAALTAIESSSSFAPVRMWWRLRRRFVG